MRSKGKLIGWNGLQFLPETEEVEVGYLLGKAFWRQGLATEGAKASVRYGFEELGLQTIPIALAKGKINQYQAQELKMILRSIGTGAIPTV